MKRNMATLVPEEEIPRDASGNLIVSGMFAAKNKSTKDCLILGRRPQNWGVSRLDCAALLMGPS